MSTAKAMRAIAIMETHLGSWYLFGGNGPNRFDCSSLGQDGHTRAGTPISRTTYTQVHDGEKVEHRRNIRVGDGIYLGPNNTHVIWAVTNKTAIHAPRTGRQVEYCNIDEKIAQLGLYAIRRMTPNSPNTYTLTRTLKQGCKPGPDVRRLRKKIGQPDGNKFTIFTARKVKAWRKAHGMKAVPVCGPAMAAALDWNYKRK